MNSKMEWPRPNALIAVWRQLLNISRRHGLFTLARLHVKLFPVGQVVALPAGATMFIPPDPHFFGFVLGTHEHHITELLLHNVRHDDTCLDVGANIGYFTSILAQLVGPFGEVLAFEPVPENFAVLKQNAELAAQRGLRIQTIQAAVSSQPGELKIIRQQWSTYHQVAAIDKDAPGVERIPAVTLDDVISRLPADRSVSLLKVDVEGHELPVVIGLQRSLAANRVRRLVIEITPGPDSVQIEKILKAHAKRIQVWSEGRWRDHSLAALKDRTDVFVEF